MPRLIDRSGGFWTEVILKKKPMELVIRQNLIPDRRAMEMIGKEAISSIKGGRKSRLNVVMKGGRLVYHRYGSGTYPFGIQKRISPDGTPYEPLKDITLRHRKYKADLGEIPTARGESFILRETSAKIFKGVIVKRVTTTSRGIAEVVVGFLNQKLALKHDQGGNARSPLFGKVKVAKIPARPFIGLQKSFVDNFHKMFGSK